MMYATRTCKTPLTAKPARAAYSKPSLSVALSARPWIGLSTMASFTHFSRLCNGARRAEPDAGDHASAGSRLMAVGRAFAVAVRGLDGEIVEIEADITSGLPGVHLVGLPDAALQESRDRVRAAITNCGHSWPMTRLTLPLSPPTLPKMGS